jgi:hypothetical protein
MDKVKEAAMTRGTGAEQDRYNAHFSPAAHGTDAHRVQQYAENLINKARGSAVTSSSFGLGYDGQQRAKMLAGGNGSGAEQVRRIFYSFFLTSLTLMQDNFGGHFGLDRSTVENAAKRVQNGARNVLEKN